ncbi:MAG: carboxypeptidase-like regulatory domain-containing protein [Terracidiphilus sp.]|jgi:uncharacterized surface anchored protein
MKIIAISTLLLLTALAAPPPEVSLGSIAVFVADQEGHPVSGATVWMRPQDGKIRASPIPDCLTDNNGKCSRDHLELTKYQITAMKEEEGYPNTAFPIYAREKKPVVVELTAAQPNASLALRVGPRSGVLTGTITDSSTGDALRNVTFVLRSTARPGDFLEIAQDSPFRILIPPGEDILVTVKAEGYKPWSPAPGPPPVRVRSS